PGSNGLLYSIPSTNPFASSTDSTIRKEIYSYGLRNPFTFDIDSQTGKIYINAVGYHTWEAVLDSTTPVNFGWDQYEGPTFGVPKAQVQTVMSGLSFAPIDMSVWNGKLYYVDLVGNVAVLNYS